ncbi:MAG: U32 family peptidase C-terminal domain-containing protein [Bacillus subtilis]|nr:U32 family peptidase C-terminal domain-containing protein [Bacillus subtilis]
MTYQGFLGGDPGPAGQLYGERGERANQEFVGLIEAYDPATQAAFVEQRNHFRPGDLLELISPDRPGFMYSRCLRFPTAKERRSTRRVMRCKNSAIRIPNVCAPYDCT